MISSIFFETYHSCNPPLFFVGTTFGHPPVTHLPGVSGRGAGGRASANADGQADERVACREAVLGRAGAEAGPAGEEGENEGADERNEEVRRDR